MLQRVLGFLFSLCLLGILVSRGSTSCCAADEALFVFSVDQASYSEGELVKLKVNAENALEDVAGFCLSIDYDDTCLSFLRVDPSEQIKSRTLQTDGSSNPVRSTYVCNVDLGHAPSLSGTVLTYVFEIKDGALVGKNTLEVTVDQVCNWKGQQTDRGCEGIVDLEVLSPKSDRAYLTSLKPASGKLKPDFSMDTYHYTLDVPYKVSSMEFETVAGENGTVSVSRKTLQKAGSTTPFTITVLSEDRKQRTQYVVDVNRAEEPEEPEWEAFLRRLVPSVGYLQPVFSPNVTEYTIDVGPDVQYMTFQAEAGEDGTASINREKLNRAGTSTDIRITAVSADKKNKRVYTVTVNRAEESVSSAVREDFFLTELQPSVGSLEPAFSPDILDYTLQVGAEVQAVTFQANTTEGATVTINRRTLYKAGSTTEIIAAVRSADKKEIKQYIVSVLRAEAPDTFAKNAAAGSSKKSTSSTGTSPIKPIAEDVNGPDFDKGEGAYIPEETDRTVSDPVKGETLAEQSTPELEQQGDSILLREDSQFIIFLAGMGAAVVCILLGIAIALLFEREKIKKS